MRTKQLLQRQLQAAGPASHEQAAPAPAPGGLLDSWTHQQAPAGQQQQQQPLHQARAQPLPPAAATAVAPALPFKGAGGGMTVMGSSAGAALRYSPVVQDSQLRPVSEEQPPVQQQAAAAPSIPRPAWKPGLSRRDPRLQHCAPSPIQGMAQAPLLSPPLHQQAGDEQPMHKRQRLGPPMPMPPPPCLPPPAIPAPVQPSASPPQHASSSGHQVPATHPAQAAPAVTRGSGSAAPRAPCPGPAGQQAPQHAQHPLHAQHTEVASRFLSFLKVREWLCCGCTVAAAGIACIAWSSPKQPCMHPASHAPDPLSLSARLPCPAGHARASGHLQRLRQLGGCKRHTRNCAAVSVGMLGFVPRRRGVRTRGRRRNWVQCTPCQYSGAQFNLWPLSRCTAGAR